MRSRSDVTSTKSTATSRGTEASMLERPETAGPGAASIRKSGWECRTRRAQTRRISLTGALLGRPRTSKKSCTAPSHLSAGSACPESEAKLAMRAVVQRVEVEGAVALVAQQFHEGRAPLFLGGLQLGVSNPQQVHLQRLDQEIL